jgi:hypothetical protein
MRRMSKASNTRARLGTGGSRQASGASRQASSGSRLGGGDIKRRWTRDEEKMLRVLARQNTHTRVIGQKLNRSEYSVRSKASELAISLRPNSRPSFG